MKKLIALISLVCIANSVFAQAQQCMAVLDNLSKGKRIRIQNGDYIKVQTKVDSLGNSIRYEGNVQINCKGVIIFPQGDRVKADDIYKISVPRQGLWRVLEGTTFLAGKVYFGISAFNGLVNNDSPIVHRSALPVLLASEAAYFAIKAHRNRWTKLKPGKHEVKVLDLTP